ncbi:MAG: hypothetical protein ACTTJ6_05175 [Treponema sp.]
MYKRRDNLIFGFHGCDEPVRDALVSGEQKELVFSNNNYDWLGKGMYFWENDPDRAMEWAKSLMLHQQNEKQKITKPAVLGAVICLGHCLDFLEHDNLSKLKKHYSTLLKDFKKKKLVLPSNKGGGDYLKRELDCLVINSFVAEQKRKSPDQAYDSVRGVFFEGNRLYPTSGFREKDHIQIAILNPNCIKGFFKVRENNPVYRLI